MADVRHTEIFDCKPEQFFKVIQDYSAYPEFLKDVKSCRVVEEQGDRKKVEFGLQIIKSLKYTSEHIEKPPYEMTWKFLEGDVFKAMNGHWKLEEQDGKTKAEYYVEARFGLLVPQSMIKSVLNANLPTMMKAYHDRVAELFPPGQESEESKEEEMPSESSIKNENEPSRVELNWEAQEETEKKGISDSLKQLFISSLSSGFISEDNIKQYVQELKLPKDVLSQVLRGAQKSKDELVGRVSNEISKMIQKIDIVKELTKLLREHKISIHADIEFSPKKKKEAQSESNNEIEH